MVACALLLALGGSAEAGLIPSFVSITDGPAPGSFVFTYDLVFTTTPDATGAPLERLEAGNFVTLYDIPGFLTAAAPADFIVGVNLVGPTAPNTTPDDDALVENVTWVYTGLTIGEPTTFPGALIVTTFSLPDVGEFTSTTTHNTGPFVGSPIGAIGSVVIPQAPSVPEPATLLLLGSGLVAVGVGSWRRRR